MKVIIFDIDGTLADISHRIHHIQNKPKNWKAFEKGIPNDSPIPEVIELYKLFFSNKNHHMFIVTGRSDHLRQDTIDWLLKHGIYYDTLYMRKKGDYREDTIIKKEILYSILAQGFEVSMAFEDRPRLVRMYREAGIKTFDVGNGEEF